MKKCAFSCLISVVAVFVFLNLYGMLVHGHLLMADYQATANLWRTQEEMQTMCIGWLAYYAVLSIILTCWFKKSRSAFAACSTTSAPSCCPIKSGGLCFGLKLGLLMGTMMASSYLYMPIPGELAVKWFFTGLVEGLGIGVILGMTCRGKTNCDMKS